jgi:DNA-directed RNA polymerase subunit RPC12/RpoP
MSYCSFSGRTVKDGDEFCANCARHLFLSMSAIDSKLERRVLCPKCHGRGLIGGPDGKKILCDNPGCENGRVQA